MKKIIYFILFQLLVYNAKTQNISFSSNGHRNNFIKIDTLFFTEYAGKKPSFKTSVIDTAFSQSLMQFDSSFGFTTKTLAEAQNEGSKLHNFKKIFSTSFYAYTDGALQAPTSVLFFRPRSEKNIVHDFSSLGKVVKHPDLNGYYYLYVNTNIYNNGDKIFLLCDSLNNAGLTIIVEPVFVRQLKLDTDPFLPNEWNVTNTGQYGGTAGADMKVANVWNMSYTGTGVKVAVIDLGVDLAHPDLQANLLTGYDATGNNSGGAPIYDQYNTHGTECAGIIAEIANTIGGVGVAYNAHIIPIRFGTVAPPNINPNGNITTSDTWESNCFNYAVNNGADIISNSWGSHGGSPSAQIDAAILNAVNNGRGGKGTIVLFAAGNENSFIDYPASNTNVIAVGASCECDTRKRSSNNPALLNPGVSVDPLGVSCDGEFWWGGNFGTGLDVMAPGVNITTTTFTPNADGTHTDTYVNNFNGTSAATPNTAAVLALILSANPNLTGQQARNILESSTDKVGGYTYQANISGQPNGTWSSDAGYGRVNACAAVNNALATILSVSGDNTFCTTSNVYNIPNLPIGATVHWDVTPAGIATPSTPNSTQTILTKNGNGIITLTATISNACGSPITVTKNNIIVGTPAPILYAIQVSLPGEPTKIDVYATTAYGSTDPIPGVTAYHWYKDGVLQGASGNEFIWYIPCNITSTLACEVVNACGTSTRPEIEETGGCRQRTSSYTVSPNPAVATVTVSVLDMKSSETSNTNPTIKEVSIYDNQGNLKRHEIFNDVKKATLDISSLQSGNYFIEISNGASKERKPLIIIK